MKTKLPLKTKTQLPYQSIYKNSPHLKRLAFSAFTFLVLVSSSLFVKAQTWNSAGSMATARHVHSATLLASGKVLVSGGEGVSACEIYDPSNDTWSSTGSMSTDRNEHTATLLASGKVLVIGGASVGTGILSTCEIYDPTTGTWSSTGSMSTNRRNHTATLLASGKVLVSGGENTGAGGSINACELYDPATGIWSSTGSLATDRYYHMATLLASGKVLVTGGLSTVSGIQSTCEIYDPATEVWSNTGSMITDRLGHTAILLTSGKILVSGGVAGGVTSSTLSSSEIYDPATGIWSSTGSMAKDRYQNTATLLASGKVLVSGGYSYSAGFTTISSCELYDPATGTWSSTGFLSRLRRNHTATLLASGKVLISGGRTFGKLSTCELYEPSNSEWSNTGSMATDRTEHTATLLANGKVLVCGGFSSSAGYTSVSSCELYDPSTGTWSSTGSMATARHFHTATLLNSGKVLISGGEGISTCEIYDPTTGTWSTTGSMSTDRLHHTATLLASGNVLVTGGHSNGAGYISVNTCELYDPTTGNWSSTGSMSTDREYHTATLLTTGKILVSAGRSNSVSSLSSCELYDPATGNWSSTGFMNIDRNDHTATLLTSGKVLVIGGSSSTVSYNSISSCELYDPATGTWSSASSIIRHRRNQTATLLVSGHVLISGGYSDGIGTLISSELYDPTTGNWSNTSFMGTDRNNHTATRLASGKVLASGGFSSWSGYIPLTTCEVYTSTICSGAGTPTGANVKTGNVILNTQTQMDAFFNNGNGNKYTKVDGDLTINGNSSSDPITNFCNLSSLTEVSGYLLIQQFTKSGNPTDLSDLAALTKAGRLGIVTCPSFETISLPGLTNVDGSLMIRNNRFAKTIHAANLASVGGGQFMIIRNFRAESIKFSNTASSFTLTNAIENASVDIQNNGDSAANALTMDFKKITAVAKNFTFTNNKNSGVSNFDNIFSGLSSVGGNMVITNNTSVAKCCIAASAVVTGTRTISGNTGNCADLTAVSADCGTLNKKNNTKNSAWKNTDLFSELTLYPSPSKGKFEISLTTTQTGTLNLRVLDLVGRVILSQSHDVSGTVSIPVGLENAPEGQYIVKLELNGNVIVKRVQVVK